MRIAFLNRGRETHPGGDVIALDETMAALRRLGVECVETGWNVQAIVAGKFDLCHMFHCNFDWSWGNYQAIRAAGKKYVLTPIYYPGLLAGITAKQLSEMLCEAAAVIPFSEKERRECVPYLRCPIIPNGTSRDFHSTRVGGHRVIQKVVTISARGMTDKNCAKVEAACERNGLPFYGLTDTHREIVKQMLQDTLVFVNASESERMSLTIGEALCAGCRVLATKENRGNEHYGPGLYTFDPRESVEVLAERIRTAYECSDDDWDWSPNIRARKLTWDLTAAMLKQVYEEVLDDTAHIVKGVLQQ